MAQDQSVGDSGGAAAPSAAAVAAAAAAAHRATEDTPHCKCGHPLHPDRPMKHRGVMMERYSCPRRRWWNGWWHPRAWMAAREGANVGG